METTFSQIQRTAYLRWESRGYSHGFDRQDWIAAERQHRFWSNYRVIAARPARDVAAASTDGRLSTRCRFCQQKVGAIPAAADRSELAALGLGFLSARDECEECSGTFAEAIDGDLAAFLTTTEPTGISVGAYKGLVRTALAILPVRDLEDHEDTIEWLSNPDHNFDFRVFSGLSCVVSRVEQAYPSPWAAVAGKTNDREPWPSLLMFLGLGSTSYLVSVPLNAQDEDSDLGNATLPDVDAPCPFAWQPDVASSRTVAIRRERSPERRLVASQV